MDIFFNEFLAGKVMFYETGNILQGYWYLLYYIWQNWKDPFCFKQHKNFKYLFQNELETDVKR